MIPQFYARGCDDCGITTVRLYREHAFFYFDVKCLKCIFKDKPSMRDEYNKSEQPDKDQFAHWLAAVPYGHTLEESLDQKEKIYWGYSSVPDEQADWWRSLPEGL